jgi:hypothetical protein
MSIPSIQNSKTSCYLCGAPQFNKKNISSSHEGGVFSDFEPTIF